MTRPTGIERRRHPRKAVCLEGRLQTGRLWHDCSIVNISPGGAKLSVAKPVGRARMVRLEIGRFGKFGAEIVWRTGSELGLRFTQTHSEMTEIVVGLAVYA